MASALSTISIDVDANTASLTRDLGKAEKAINASTAKMHRKLTRVDRIVLKFGRSMKKAAKSALSFRGALVLAAGAAGIGLLFKRSIDLADTIGKTADAIGISTDVLQEYRFALDLVGVSAAAVDKGMLQFAKGMGEARAESGTFVTLLKKTDPVLLKQLKGITDTERGLDAYWLAMSKATNAQDLMALSAAAFGGRGGKQFVLGINDGFDALQKSRKAAHGWGAVVNESLIRSAERAKDQLSIFSMVLKTQVATVLLTATPLVLQLGEAFRDAVPYITAFIQKFLPNEFKNVEALSAHISDINEKIEQHKIVIKGLLDLDSGKKLFRDPSGDRLPGQSLQSDPAVVAELAQVRQLIAAREELIALRVRAIEQAAIIKKKIDEAAVATAAAGSTAATVAEKVDKLTKSYALKTRMLSLSSEQQEIWNEHIKVGLDPTKELNQAIVDSVRHHRAMQAELARGARLVEAYAAAEESAAAQMAAARKKAGAVTIFGDAVAGADLAKQSVDSFASHTTDAFTEMARSGKLDFASMADAIISDILRMTSRMLIFRAVSGALGTQPGSLFGPRQATPTGEYGYTPDFAKGGSFIVGGSGGTDSQFVPIRATPGERVTVETPAQQRRGPRTQIAPAGQSGGDNVLVQIIDQRGASAPPPEVSRRRGAGGQQVIQAIIRAEVAGFLGDGSADKMLGSTFGMRRQGG